MENYSKGRNEEEDWDRDKIQIPNLPENFIWMHVKTGSKMFNLLAYALNRFNDTGVVLWSGSGPAVAKTIGCAEIMKRRKVGLHQINKICYRKVREYWLPHNDELDDLVVTREIPAIHILLSKEALNDKEPGYQAPFSRQAFRKSSSEYNKQRDMHKRSAPRVDSKKFQALGLRSNTYKRQNNLSVPTD